MKMFGGSVSVSWILVRLFWKIRPRLLRGRSKSSSSGAREPISKVFEGFNGVSSRPDSNVWIVGGVWYVIFEGVSVYGG